jgi:hypothetical protein
MVKSGSPAMLLLQRGRDAMERATPTPQIEHFHRLIDHDPDFAKAGVAAAAAYFTAGEFGRLLPVLPDPRGTILAMSAWPIWNS